MRVGVVGRLLWSRLHCLSLLYTILPYTTLHYPTLFHTTLNQSDKMIKIGYLLFYHAVVNDLDNLLNFKAVVKASIFISMITSVLGTSLLYVALCILYWHYNLVHRAHDMKGGWNNCYEFPSTLHNINWIVIKK